MLNETAITETTPLITKRVHRGTAQLETSEDIELSQKESKQLKRSLGLLQALSFVFGVLFGSGVFISPGLVAKQTNSMGVALLLWISCGAVAMLGALCFCELASCLKKTGGEYIFIKETYGDFAGFFLIWAQTFIIFPIGRAVISTTIGQYCVSAFYDSSSVDGAWLVKAVAIFCMTITLIINSVSTSFVGKTQVCFFAIQVIALTLLLATGVWKVSTGNTQNYPIIFDSDKPFDLADLSLAFYDCLYALGGWGFICTITEELQNPSRDLRLAIFTGIPLVTLCYLLINLSIMSELTHEEMGKTLNVISTFIRKSLGEDVALIVPIFCFLFGFSGLNSAVCVTSRSLLSAAREGHLPEPISYIHRSRRTPIPAVTLNYLLSAIWIVAARSKTQSLITYVSFAIWLTYGVAIFGVIVLRMGRPDLPRPFKVWIANPIFMTLVSLYLVLSPFAKQPIESSISLACLLIAIPVYYLVIYDHKYKIDCIGRAKEKCYGYLMSMFNLVPCVYKDDKEDNIRMCKEKFKSDNEIATV